MISEENIERFIKNNIDKQRENEVKNGKKNKFYCNVCRECFGTKNALRNHKKTPGHKKKNQDISNNNNNNNNTRNNRKRNANNSNVNEENVKKINKKLITTLMIYKKKKNKALKTMFDYSKKLYSLYYIRHSIISLHLVRFMIDPEEYIKYMNFQKKKQNKNDDNKEERENQNNDKIGGAGGGEKSIGKRYLEFRANLRLSRIYKEYNDPNKYQINDDNDVTRYNQHVFLKNKSMKYFLLFKTRRFNLASLFYSHALSCFIDLDDVNQLIKGVRNREDIEVINELANGMIDELYSNYPVNFLTNQNRQEGKDNEEGREGRNDLYGVIKSVMNEITEFLIESRIKEEITDDPNHEEILSYKYKNRIYYEETMNQVIAIYYFEAFLSIYEGIEEQNSAINSFFNVMKIKQYLNQQYQTMINPNFFNEIYDNSIDIIISYVIDVFDRNRDEVDDDNEQDEKKIKRITEGKLLNKIVNNLKNDDVVKCKEILKFLEDPYESFFIFNIKSKHYEKYQSFPFQEYYYSSLKVMKEIIKYYASNEYEKLKLIPTITSYNAVIDKYPTIKYQYEEICQLLIY
eukprot:TRINITY_DN7198_c0_g1_i1.p1 TRINITY_DN7198_c0_g1~~TRINITY_DN7198_c0_g1_i1.p1  ORF type:complete len:574 (-),score=147.81 TRINITY_DN7198_c0_g1_i1:65-1786(-)